MAEEERNGGRAGEEENETSGGRIVRVQEVVGFSLLEEGMYEAELTEIREIETQFGQSWRWIFRVLDAETENGDTPLVSGVTSQRLSTRSKAYAWISALLGRNLKGGETIDLDSLVGKKAQVEIRNRRMRDGTEVSNVVDVKPLPRKRARARKAKRAGEEEEGE